MEIQQVASAGTLFELLMEPPASEFQKTVYRGVSDSRYQLIPSIGRIPSLKAGDEDQRLQREQLLIQDFRKFARPYFESGMPDDWELLAIAQHHGLPTRLLDWSRNPLVAAYFAVESLTDSDGGIFTFNISSFTSTAGLDPFDIDTTMTVELPHVTRRITAQSGVFTLNSDPFVAMEEQPDISPFLVKYVIPADMKKSILLRLHRLGMNRATLFPGAEGVAQHMRWEVENAGEGDANQ